MLKWSQHHSRASIPGVLNWPKLTLIPASRILRLRGGLCARQPLSAGGQLPASVTTRTNLVLEVCPSLNSPSFYPTTLSFSKSEVVNQAFQPTLFPSSPASLHKLDLSRPRPVWGRLPNSPWHPSSIVGHPSCLRSSLLVQFGSPPFQAHPSDNIICPLFTACLFTVDPGRLRVASLSTSSFPSSPSILDDISPVNFVSVQLAKASLCTNHWAFSSAHKSKTMISLRPVLPSHRARIRHCPVHCIVLSVCPSASPHPTESLGYFPVGLRPAY